MSKSVKGITLFGRTVPLPLILGGAVFFALLLYYTILPALFPLHQEDIREGYAESYRIYDRNDQLLREAVNPWGCRAIWLDLEEIDPFFIDSVIAAEDESFYHHKGVSYPALLRAMTQNIRSLKVESGASTITMQLARIVKGNRRNILGKIGQIYQARRMEFGMTKEEILEHYLNRVPMGRGNWGIQAASWEYYGTDHNLLSRGQLTTLAGIIQGPTLYNPVTAPERAAERRTYVVSRLKELQLISGPEGEILLAEPIITYTKDQVPRAMHFTDHVLKEKPPAGRLSTTIDVELNEKIERLVQSHVQKFEKEGMKQGAVVVIDNETLEIRAMVGSPDYWDEDKGSNNGATMLRQPGSALKPFTYSLAFEKGWQPGDVIADVPINYYGHEDRLYEPQNITGEFSGPVMLQDALTRSLNIPAIKLARDVGVENLLDRLHRAGFTDLDKNTDYYGLGLTLGNGEVSPLQLATGFALFANGGTYHESHWDFRPLDEGEPIFRESTAFLITEILSNDRLKMMAFGNNNPLLMGFPISIKTGTSNNWR
ncbi:MAG: transglycosylase domain-containing protein, partial [Spirochaetales bacterium]|nr:transglycosylase domain-containing protein [Spirochaetales bacterium]